MSTLPLTQLDTKKHRCAGCRDDYYNHGSASSVGHCWALPDARFVWRWAINMQTPMDSRARFRKVRVHHCFHGEGPYRDIYMARLPPHLGGEWADKNEQAAEEGKA